MQSNLITSLLIVSLIASVHTGYAQGCVAIRNGGSSCTNQAGVSHEKGWQFSTNYRYFKSFRHYRENHEEKERVEKGSDVRNYSNFLDLTLVRNINSRWAVAVNVPMSATTRTSLYEHDGRTRHSTSSVGLGDIRVAAYRWLVDPTKMTRFNMQLGLGIKFATGDYRYQDLFYRNDSTKVLAPVDQSIQLGDGGTGLTTEANLYYNFSNKLSLYGNFYYLVNPREQNGTSTARGATPSAANIANGSFVMSVPDQYMIRLGVNAKFKNLNASLGVRDECIPVHDLIGGSNGFRRPGYIISAEPGLNYNFKTFTAYAYVPVALVRDRTQSVPDKIRSNLTGTRTVGDAAFADYSINLGLAFRFQ
ncbi:hypothetical protein EXU57_04410 [Segetibacter sp. 3557_3]|uniref:hypothetical protein n=1 Tax=Segetibacter sp. 3557_3 TaxID=2547429 RepID=UPI001058E80A|nr:hypothetical protein [Segetibacter sp. 3557_3]TDH29312.1 hypothetical protein EXU57_04410 [Segetibacter sp. 3557_3]